MTETDTDKNGPGLRRTTLGELGPVLPFGQAPDGSLGRDLECRPWRMPEERAIGAIRDKLKGGGMGRFVSDVVAFMFPQFGPHNLAEASEAQRALLVGQMAIGDVQYAYLWLRRQAIGTELQLRFTCPACAGVCGLTADLDSVDVKVADTPDAAAWSFELREPIMVRGREARVFHLGQPAFSALSKVKGGKVHASTADALIVSAVRAVDDRAIPLVASDLDGLTKRDIEALLASIDEHAVGPDMSVREECPSCGAEIKTSIDWGYDAFFSAASSR